MAYINAAADPSASYAGRWGHSPRGKYGLPPNTMALITSGPRFTCRWAAKEAVVKAISSTRPDVSLTQVSRGLQPQ